jgi:hypothetical protein
MSTAEKPSDYDVGFPLPSFVRSAFTGSAQLAGICEWALT